MIKIKRLKEKGLNMSALYGVKDKVCFYKAWWGNERKWIVDPIELSNFTDEDERSEFNTYQEAKEYAEKFIK